METMLKNKKTIICFLLPGLVVYLVSVIMPIVWSGYYSLFNWRGYGRMNFVGLGNFITMVSDAEMWQSVVHTLIYTFWQIVLQVGGGVLLAVLLTHLRAFRKPFQVLYYLPVIISTVALCQMFKKMFAVVPAGLVNQLLALINPAWIKLEWLTNTKTSLAMVTLVAGYKNMPVYMAIFTAAFMTIPASFVEAARIDGANNWTIFWKIKLPQIRPTLITSTILVMNGSLRGYDIARLLTAGGPINSSQLQAMYMYKQAFTSQKYGYGSAVAMFIVFEALLLAVLVRHLTDKEN